MFQLDLLIHVQPLIIDIGSTKKPALTRDTSNEIILRFYGQHFLHGWLKVKDKQAFKPVISN